MDRRTLLKRFGSLLCVAPFVRAPLQLRAWAAGAGPRPPFRRVRPVDPGWPTSAHWENLNQQVGDRLTRVQFPLASCSRVQEGPECEAIFGELKNPYYVGDQAGLTQTCGWVDAWTSKPSMYVVTAQTAQDVAAAINFAREHRLRVVVKGGGHSYQGTSNSADSLLIWTREMDAITLHDAFVGVGCRPTHAPQRAVSLGAGAIWMRTYAAVTTQGGRYVQGGGCATVGVAGLIQSGGFGSFSKNYGMAAAGLLEAEVVTADGVVRVVNACQSPDLFWGLKGGGGGSLGVVTRLTLRTRELPKLFGVVTASIKATSDSAFRRLINRLLTFYAGSLFNPHWGESVTFKSNALDIYMRCHGLEEQQPALTWKPFLDWVAAAPGDFSMEKPPGFLSIPARQYWDPEFLRKNRPGVAIADSRPGASESDLFWAGNLGEAGWYVHGFESAWLPDSLLRPERLGILADALFSATRHWPVALHFNKGLAGAPPEEIAAARETAMNPAVLSAFALALSAAEGPPAFPGISGHEPNVRQGRKEAAEVHRAMDELRKLAPNAGSYVSESDFFDPSWQHSFWGTNYPRLLAVKRKYDPDGLFFVHHGVGSEEWSTDGFTKLT
jgi:FAD/FMN-containing dehydrogenase